MKSKETIGGAGSTSPASAGSAFLLSKRCPDGRVITLNLESEKALQEHVESMWRYTPGFSLVAVVMVPNESMKRGE